LARAPLPQGWTELCDLIRAEREKEETPEFVRLLLEWREEDRGRTRDGLAEMVREILEHPVVPPDAVGRMCGALRAEGMTEEEIAEHHLGPSPFQPFPAPDPDPPGWPRRLLDWARRRWEEGADHAG
jgi:hypothetical protein